jgi:hypothetical protein
LADPWRDISRHIKQLSTIQEEDGEDDRAVVKCQASLANGINDETRTGFVGRMERISKKATQSTNPGAGTFFSTPLRGISALWIIFLLKKQENNP